MQNDAQDNQERRAADPSETLNSKSIDRRSRFDDTRLIRMGGTVHETSWTDDLLATTVTIAPTAWLMA